MESGTQEEGGLIPGINPYLQNIAENSIDDLSGKNDIIYESEMQQTDSYNVETNVEVHQGDTTFIQHTEYHETTTVTTEVYQDEAIPVTQAESEYVLEQGGENVFMPESGNVATQEYATEVVADQEVVNGNEANYVYEEQTDAYEEPVTQENVVQDENSTVTGEHIADKHITDEHVTEEHVTEEHVVEESISGEHISEEQVPEEHIAEEHIAAEEAVISAPEETPDTSVAEIQFDSTDNVAEVESSVEDRNDQSVDDNLVIAEKPDEQIMKEENTDTENIVPQTADDSPEQSMDVVDEPSSAGTVGQIEPVKEDRQEDVYNVMETTDQSFDENTSQAEAEETLVLIHSYDDVTNESSEHTSVTHLEESEEYVDDIREESQSRASNRSEDAPSEYKPRGRKSSSNIPLHILGHHLERPVDAVANGRAAKPRLGVKVPYRNLTSQIVSKEEIQKEIVERGKRKQQESIAKGDIVFARQLTKRLATKLSSNDTEQPQVEKLVESIQNDHNDQDTAPETPNTTQSSEIRDNNALLAILEGDGEDMPPVLPKEVTSAANIEKIKTLEREIALQQLHDLPYLTPTQKTFKGRHNKAPMLTAQVKKEESTDSGIFSSPAKPSNKENSTKTTADKKDITKKIPIEVEPQIKVNMALKTYSRKRKTSEPSNSPVEPKKTAPNETADVKQPKIETPPDVYVTKSSRVIKKKVIWDPDEARSPRPYSRSSDVGSMSPRPGQSKPEKPSEKHVEKKAAVEKPKEEKKEKPSERKVYEKSPKKEISEKPIKKEIVEKSPNKEIPKEKSIKKEPVAETPKKSPPKNVVKAKKGKTEVDKLLGDEGAIKMLYELKNDGEPAIKKKKDVISVTRTFKELRKRANELKSDLESSSSSESPKNLRKKDSRDNTSPAPTANSPAPSPAAKPTIAATISRQKSKDSARSSLHTPPPSPGFVPNAETYLIRRRSSSSISSGDEAGANEEKPAKKQGGDSQKGKKGRKSETKEAKKKQQQMFDDEVMGTEEEMKNIEKTLRKKNEQERQCQYETFVILKNGKHINIDLHYNNQDYFCSVLVLRELTSVLNKYAKQKDCNVVSITSSGTAFCLGLPYKSLVSNDEAEVKRKAEELATHVRDFLLCLLHFPKILIAGIQGDCSGLAVTMLPLFDVVIASDTATFSTPYTALGCAAEAGFLLGLPQINRGLAANLLFTSNVQNADAAFKGGLVSKLCWPEKYKDALRVSIMSISKGSKQSLESNKAQLRSTYLKCAEAEIKAGTSHLVDLWTSSECQKNFAVRVVGN